MALGAALARTADDQLEGRRWEGCLGRQDRRADVAVDLEPVADLVQGLSRRRAQAASEALRTAREQCEAASAKPVRAPVVADRIAELACEPSEQRVATRVAIRVVVVLEAVKREQIQGERLALAAAGDRAPEVGEQLVGRRQAAGGSIEPSRSAVAGGTAAGELSTDVSVPAAPSTTPATSPSHAAAPPSSAAATTAATAATMIGTALRANTDLVAMQAHSAQNRRLCTVIVRTSTVEATWSELNHRSFSRNWSARRTCSRFAIASSTSR